MFYGCCLLFRDHVLMHVYLWIMMFCKHYPFINHVYNNLIILIFAKNYFSLKKGLLLCRVENKCKFLIINDLNKFV